MYKILFYVRLYIDDPNAKYFDIKDKHMPGNVVDNLKIALIQETEESSNGSPPKIYDLELCQHQNSHSETVCYLKVLNYYLFLHPNCLSKIKKFLERKTLDKLGKK